MARIHSLVTLALLVSLAAIGAHAKKGGPPGGSGGGHGGYDDTASPVQSEHSPEHSPELSPSNSPAYSPSHSPEHSPSLEHSPEHSPKTPDDKRSPSPSPSAPRVQQCGPKLLCKAPEKCYTSFLNRLCCDVNKSKPCADRCCSKYDLCSVKKVTSSSGKVSYKGKCTHASSPKPSPSKYSPSPSSSPVSGGHGSPSSPHPSPSKYSPGPASSPVSGGHGNPSSPTSSPSSSPHGHHQSSHASPTTSGCAPGEKVCGTTCCTSDKICQQKNGKYACVKAYYGRK